MNSLDVVIDVHVTVHIIEKKVKSKRVTLMSGNLAHPKTDTCRFL